MSSVGPHTVLKGTCYIFAETLRTASSSKTYTVVLHRNETWRVEEPDGGAHKEHHPSSGWLPNSNDHHLVPPICSKLLFFPSPALQHSPGHV